MISMEKRLELVKETVVEEMEAVKEIKEVTTKELVKAFGIGAIKGFIGATAVTAVAGVIAIAIAKKMN